VRVISLLASAVLFFAAIPMALGETVYVTDELQLRLQAEPTESSAVVGSLRSGDKLELLEKAGFFALVRTEDGKQGWAKAGYLIPDRPARARLQELEAELKALRASVEPAQVELENERRLAQDLGQKLENSQLELVQRTAAVEQLELENAEYRQQLGIGDWKMPWRWAALAALLALAGGVGLGVWWFDYRSRKRHGGFRIY
jgi:SH3 domain protein